MDTLGENTRLVRRAARLSTGHIRTEHSDRYESDALYGFGERINPRRSFVFVSRLLGRHVPVKPCLARRAFGALADQLPADLVGPVLVTSMAETAVGLGAGVHDAYIRRTARHDVLNFSSTRTARPQPIFGNFSEDHSHASGHTLYEPALESDKKLLKSSRTLIMVDDETSSGNTFRSLGKALNSAGLNHFERVFALTLTDWSSDAIMINSKVSDSGTLEAERMSLLSGSYTWTAIADAPVMTLPDPDIPSSLAIAPVYRIGDARVGNSGLTDVCIPNGLLHSINSLSNGKSADTRPVLILGSGEHVWEPFLLAEALERQGIDVRFSASTRSPILTGHDIRCAFAFRDHEGLGISNYLYNVNPDDYSTIVVCVDTAVDALDRRLLSTLAANVFFDGQFIEYDKLGITRDEELTGRLILEKLKQTRDS